MKMKTIIKTIGTIALIGAVALLAACNNDQLDGTSWKYDGDEDMVITFNRPAVTVKQGEDTYTGTYTVSGSTFTITIETATYTIDGETAVITVEGGDTSTGTLSGNKLKADHLIDGGTFTKQ
jgi:hypothetical protein